MMHIRIEKVVVQIEEGTDCLIELTLGAVFVFERDAVFVLWANFPDED